MDAHNIQRDVIRFFWSPKNRYWKRKAQEIIKLVQAFSSTSFGKALGDQGELLADSAFFNAGFALRAKTVREWSGKKWQGSGHNLDRVYERDGIAYGAEIKNTLKYIPADELRAKIAMCRFLGLRPIVIARSLPAHYIYQLDRAGGFGVIVGKQLYPFGYEDLAEQVRERLGSKVECSRAIEQGRIKVFLDWHEQNVKGIPRIIKPTRRKQEYGRDVMVENAKEAVRELFRARSTDVFYDQQLQVLLEERPHRFSTGSRPQRFGKCVLVARCAQKLFLSNTHELCEYDFDSQRPEKNVIISPVFQVFLRTPINTNYASGPYLPGWSPATRPGWAAALSGDIRAYGHAQLDTLRISVQSGLGAGCGSHVDLMRPCSWSVGPVLAWMLGVIFASLPWRPRPEGHRVRQIALTLL
jgi:hypothetical protein